MAEVGKIFLVEIDCIFRMIVRKNEQICLCIEEGRLSGDCKDDFMNKKGWNREVKIY